MDPATASSQRARYLFLDVRQPEEFAAGHIAGARHIPIGDVKTRWNELPHDREVVVVCQIGQRSALVSGFLRSEGVQAHNLEGGLEAWISAGLPLQTEQGATGRVIDGWARDIEGRLLRDRDTGSDRSG